MVLHIRDTLSALTFCHFVAIYYVSFRLFAINQCVGGYGLFNLATLSVTVLSAPSPPLLKVFIK